MNHDFDVPVLGPCQIIQPPYGTYFVDDCARVLLNIIASYCPAITSTDASTIELAGPRRKIFFDPAKTRAAIVTCGGLCPGLNDVIRAITMVLWYRYGVRDISGLRYGYEGVVAKSGHTPMPLNPDVVADIHKDGGTILGSSRGDQPVGEMVDFLQANNINILFTIGGDGTQRGAREISDEARNRGYMLSVVGIPKTIDNDIAFTDRTFGFETAVAMSREPITCAHREAKGVRNGVGLVKLMGRESGFVAAYASMASSDVNLVLVPEVPFTLPGVMRFLEARMIHKSHALIVVAEGAGQDMVSSRGVNASGNKIFGDIGQFLRDEIETHFKASGTPVSVKYIDPSYMIRSMPANADDSVFCFNLAANAVHAAMAGRTAMFVSHINGYFVHIPLATAAGKRKQIDPASELWQSVLDNTGQPMTL